MRMASVVALLLVLDASVEALKSAPVLQSQSGQMKSNPKSNQLKQAYALPYMVDAPRAPPQIKKGTGDPLRSFDKFVLESEVVPGFFMTHRNSSDMGDKDKWLDLRHITGGEWGLIKGVSQESVFNLKNEHRTTIKSGDMVNWMHGGQEMDLLFASSVENDGAPGYQWPNPLVRKAPVNKDFGLARDHFLIEHARDVDLATLRDQPNTAGGWGWNTQMKQDPRLGEEIKDGDSIWMRHKAGLADVDGDWFFMSGDPAEGYHVAFPHHLVGFDGWIPHYAMENWTNVNDAHATSSRFTVRKVKEDGNRRPKFS